MSSKASKYNKIEKFCLVLIVVSIVVIFLSHLNYAVNAKKYREFVEAQSQLQDQRFGNSEVRIISSTNEQ
ncbi:hypothetical protein ACFL0U_03330 [Pseudomonadota bacterium]